MVKVTNQFRDHPLMPLLNKYIDSKTGIAGSTTRGKPYKPRGPARSILSKLGNAIFKHCVEKWNALPEEAKQWYSENAPPEFCTGFLWWTWSCLIKNYNAGFWTVNASAVGGHCYIRPEGLDEGIWSRGYIDATEIGTLANIDWVPGCPEEGLPLLLVHGWYPGAFDPYDAWKTMTLSLTGKDPTVATNYVLVYDPAHPGDPNYALRCIEGEGKTVYISNYTHSPGGGTPDDIRKYAKSLAREIEVLKGHRGAPAVDILSHSMGALVARAYIENQDLPGNPFPAPYRGDVRGFTMIAPPNQGAHFDTLYPGCWDWTSVIQMLHGSEFLTQLNSGTTGNAKGVTYQIIAGNAYDCENLKLTPLPELLEWLEPFFVEGLYGKRTVFPYHASRLCEVSNGETNDGEILVKDTVLAEQDGQPEVTPDRYYVYPWDHWAMLGRPIEKCEAATLVKIILANYDLTKWRAKGKDIEPPKMNWVQHALYLLKKSKTAYEIHNYIVDHNVGLEIEDLPPGMVAKFDDLRNAIIIDPSAEAESEKVVGQYLAHEGEHARWYPVNSIFQEYHAFQAEADFWNEVKKGDTDDVCDWVAGFIAQGKQAAMNYIRTIPGFEHLPTYAQIHEDLESAVTILDNLAGGYPPFKEAQRKGIEFTFEDTSYDVFAEYYPDQKKGGIHEDYQDEHPKVLAAYLAYLCYRAKWDCADSINQEWTCFDYMAKVWKAIRGSMTHQFLDEVVTVTATGKSYTFYWLLDQIPYCWLPTYYP